MARTISREVASIGIPLVDEAYMSWCTAQTQCQNALRAWFDAGPRNRAEANCAYRPWIASRQPPATSSRCRSWRTLRDGLVVEPCVRKDQPLPRKGTLDVHRRR
jgi:hypothetical protein